MKIRFIADTYIRTAPTTSGDPPVGIVFKGTEIEVEPDLIIGDPVQDNDRWYCDRMGQYYWSGGAEVIASTATEEKDIRPRPEETVPAELPRQQSPIIPESSDPTVSEDPDFAPQAKKITPRMPVDPTSTVGPEPSSLTGDSTSDLRSTAERLRAEKRFKEELHASRPSEMKPVSSVQPPVEQSGLPADSPEMPVPKEPTGPLAVTNPWANILPDQLNWGIRNYRIAPDWWAGRQFTGKQVRIAILSTGVDPDHPDLQGVTAFYQSGESGVAMSDVHGLGTQAAVVAAGTGEVVFGIAPEADVLIGKIGEQDHMISQEALIEGLAWAIEERADIIAMLVDFPDIEAETQEALQELLSTAQERGVILLAPVGTSEHKKPEKRYPAALPGVVSVGSHDQYGQRSAFSARSYKLDLLAPGEGLLTTGPDLEIVENSHSTAMATAFFAGFLALMYQAFREHNRKTEDIIDLLRETAVSPRPFNKGKDVEYGYGLLNPIDTLKRLS